MELVFVDETSDVKFKDYFGICCATVNHTKYRTIKAGFHSVLTKGGWDPTIEFKGSYLFSASKGCLDVSVEDRINLASKILALNASDKNARMKFAYLKLSTDQVKSAFLASLPELVLKVLPKATKKPGKDLASVHCDYRSDITSQEISAAIGPALSNRGYTLVEDVVLATSNFNTVGVIFADLVAYLVARADVISSDFELFEGLTPEMAHESGKIKKLKSSVGLINQIKKLELYKLQ